MTQEIIENSKAKMEKAISSFHYELATIRTGRANPSILDRVQVEYWGSMTPINQVANISVVEGRQLVIKAYDKNTLKDIVRAIHEADLGLNPQNDGQIIRIIIPSLTEERRKELAKSVGKYAETAKVAIRNVRRDANEDIKKESLPEDEEKRAQEQIQKLTDQYIKTIDGIAKEKEKEILTV